MRWQGVCFRAHDPRWSWTPLSGEGAKLKGGRFNPVGIATLYLALTLDGMFAEMAHGFAYRFEPLTVCCYKVDVADIVDLSSEPARTSHAVDFAAMACDWAYELASGRIPASWALAERFRSDGAAGLLTPSFARGAASGACNLILWKWGADAPHKVDVFDPADRLPKNQSSWL